MACLVCINFSLPLPASKTLIQLLQSKEVKLVILMWIPVWVPVFFIYGELSSHLYKQLVLEKNQWKSAVGRFSNQATTRRTGMNSLTPITTDRRISSVEAWSCLPHKMAHAIRFWEPVSFHLNVSAGPTVICGYWVGPDVEDGWGYVNAFVNQIL